MGNRRFTHLQNIIVFAAVVFACLFFTIFLGRENFAGKMFSEFRAPLFAMPSQISDLEKFWQLNSNSKRALIEAGRDLARVNSSYELRLMENKALRDKVDRYERIFNMSSHENFRFEVARVAGRDINAWWQRLVIRKGSMHGIKAGSAVICADGVVGRVSEVNLYTSVVELASSRHFRMAANFEGDNRPVIYQGAGAVSFRHPIGKLRDVPADLSPSINRPLKLVTSSLAGTFPDGVLIGYVDKLELASDGIFKLGTVNLSRGLSSLREVAVLVKVED